MSVDLKKNLVAQCLDNIRINPVIYGSVPIYKKKAVNTGQRKFLFVNTTTLIKSIYINHPRFLCFMCFKRSFSLVLYGVHRGNIIVRFDDFCQGKRDTRKCPRSIQERGLFLCCFTFLAFLEIPKKTYHKIDRV